MNMFRLDIRSFLISCEIENIISVGVEQAVKPRGFKKALSQSMNGIIQPDRPNQCPVFFQSYTLKELRDIPRAPVRTMREPHTVLHCRPRRSCDAASKWRPRSWLGGRAVTWIQFAALLFISHASSGTSPSQKLFICDGRKHLTPSEVGTRTNVIRILDTKVTKII